MEEKNVKEMLNEVLCKKLNQLDDFDFGSKEHSIAVDNIVKLYRLKIDDDKADNDAKNKQHENTNYNLRQMEEIELKNKQLDLDTEIKKIQAENLALEVKTAKIDKMIKYGIEILSVILPLRFYALWMRRGFEFERTGTFTSTTFRNLFNNFKPSKK